MSQRLMIPKTDGMQAVQTPAPTRLDSGRLFAGQREVLIVHQGETYRLRITRQDKLILTK